MTVFNQETSVTTIDVVLLIDGVEMADMALSGNKNHFWTNLQRN